MEDQTTQRGSAHTFPRVLVLLDNLFFAGKINQAAHQTSIKPLYAKTAAQALELARAEQPVQIIVDLDAAQCLPLEFIVQIKADTVLRTIPLVGFASHINLDLQQHARQAGCDRVITRSSFDRFLAQDFGQV